MVLSWLCVCVLCLIMYTAKDYLLVWLDMLLHFVILMCLAADHCWWGCQAAGGVGDDAATVGGSGQGVDTDHGEDLRRHGQLAFQCILSLWKVVSSYFVFVFCCAVWDWLFYIKIFTMQMHLVWKYVESVIKYINIYFFIYSYIIFF